MRGHVGLTRSTLSVEGCPRNHGFPWHYADLFVDAEGHMLCPSCRTEITHLWTTA